MATKSEEQSAGWAVFNDGGEKFCDYDSLDGFVDSNESEVPTEPQELGTLYSYNKVRAPSEATVVVLFGGNYSTQGASLAKLRSYLTSTEVFTIQTPSRALDNMTVVGVSVTRGATENANMLAVEVTFKEVMSYYKTKKKISPSNPTSMPTQNNGNALTKQMDKMKDNVQKPTSNIDKVTETFKGVKDSVTSGIATAKQNIETVRSTVSNYLNKARAVQNWARTQMTEVSSEVSAIKSTFTTAKEVISFNGVKSTFWKGVNNVKDTENSARSLLKELEQ